MTANQDDKRDTPAGDPGTMIYWLGRRLRRLREDAGLSLGRIAPFVEGAQKGQPIDPSTLSRLERGETWTPHPDMTVATYARLCETDARVIWYEAAEDFRTRGGAPVSGRMLSRAERAVLLAQEGALRSQPYGDESQEKPTSTRTRTAE